jgi:hypothetical protein
MQNIIRYLLGVSMSCGSISLVSAHPGHGQDGGSYSLAHYLSEPAHFGAGLALIGLIAVGIYGARRHLRRRDKAMHQEHRQGRV